ncbi:hypothetical protein [Candidatus Avelusimicrobium luingense]|uniref:hypothetical protein n=1 Tax=Candidatus Avelusimicrobium luingense TaxID=3416211 RepID=UPI003D0B00B1
MTVSMQLTKRIYAGNGITRQWEVDFPLYAADNLQVFITSPQGVQTQVTTGYALNVTNDMLTYPVEESGQEPLASGWTITLVRNTPPTQQIDLLRQGELDAEVLEQGYDKLTLIAQELSEKIDRCIKYPVSTQPGALDTDTFFNEVMTAKQSAVTASVEAAAAANTASASAAIATSTAQQAVSDIAMAKQNATGAISAQTQTACQQVEQSTAAAVGAAQTAQYYAEHTLGKFVGEVFYSQSSSAQDNPGGLPLFTGETIANADELYPDFYQWVATHTELQISAADYETAITTYGECPKYVIDTTNKTIRLPKLTNYVKMANTTDGITQSGAVPSGAGAGNSSQCGATPAHTTLYPWVCAYNAAIPASTAQAAQFQQALTGKTDTDLSNIANVSQTARAEIVSWMMPDYESAVAITATVVGTYNWVQIPCDAIVCVHDPANQDHDLFISKTGSTADAIPLIIFQDASNGSGFGNGWALVPKGWYVSCQGFAGTTATYYPLKGVN